MPVSCANDAQLSPQDLGLGDPKRERDQAARILARNSSTWPRSRSAWVLSASAADLTPCAAAPVASAPAVTPAMLSDTSWVRRAASWGLRVISWVAAPCSSTAEAIDVPTLLTSPLVPP